MFFANPFAMAKSSVWTSLWKWYYHNIYNILSKWTKNAHNIWHSYGGNGFTGFSCKRCCCLEGVASLLCLVAAVMACNIFRQHKPIYIQIFCRLLNCVFHKFKFEFTCIICINMVPFFTIDMYSTLLNPLPQKFDTEF